MRYLTYSSADTSQTGGSGRHAYVAVLASAVTCYAALGAVLRILPPLVQGRLHGGDTALGLAVGAPALTAVALRPLGGRLADHRRPVRVLAAGALLMSAVTSPLLATDDFGLLLGARLAVGVAEGLMMSAAVLAL